MTLLQQWTALCWLGFWLVWMLAWLFTKPARWQQRSPDSLRYGMPLALSFIFLFLGFRHGQLGWINTPIFPQPVGVIWLGFFLTLTGLFLALWARAALGRNWSSSMDLKKDHELVTTGPYALVRHPIYSALIMMYAGSTLVVATPLALVGCGLLLWSCLMRIGPEEALMTREFSAAYPAYVARTKRLVPWVW